MSLDWQGQYDDPNLDTEFTRDLQGVLGPDADNWRVEKPAYRSPEEQDALYAKGRDAMGNIVDPSAVVTYARAGQSAHNYGRAADITRLVGTGVLARERWDYDDPAWARIRSLVDAHPRLHGGWHFPSPDPDHIEKVGWRNLGVSADTSQ